MFISQYLENYGVERENLQLHRTGIGLWFEEYGVKRIKLQLYRNPI